MDEQELCAQVEEVELDRQALKREDRVKGSDAEECCRAQMALALQQGTA